MTELFSLFGTLGGLVQKVSYLLRRHAHAVIGNAQQYVPGIRVGGDIQQHAAVAALGFQPVEDGVFHQRLQGEPGNHAVPAKGLAFNAGDLNLQVAAVAVLLDGKVIVEQCQLLLQRHQLLGAFGDAFGQPCKGGDHLGNAGRVLAFESDGRANGVKMVEEVEAELGDARLDDLIGAANHEKLAEDIELLDGAAEEFDLDAVQHGELSPVFFGSALTNFGVEPFLENFLRLTPTPLARVDSLTGEPVDPCRDEFSAFIFKIQANMNKAHRDRIAFMRICSGKFERGMEAYHVQEGKNIKLATGTQLMAQDRAIVDEAYAGDIIGLFDPGIFSIGDTLCTGKKKVQFAGIPTFSPEHFARIEQKDTMKRKQFVKGMEQIAQEGAIQIFREVGGGMEEVVVGVVGVLQLEVLEYRLNTEYNVEIRMQQLPFEQLRWVKNDPDTYNLRDLDLTSDTKAVEDMKGNRLLLFTSDWAVRWAETHNDTLELSEFGNI